jgi:hypothetical protein
MVSTDLQDRLLALERQILEAQKHCDYEVIAALLAADFREVGSSGRIYTKTEILEAIREVEVLDYSLEQPRATSLGQNCVLLTYVATLRRCRGACESLQRSHRSSIWIERDGKWQVLYHQGTPIP